MSIVEDQPELGAVPESLRSPLAAALASPPPGPVPPGRVRRLRGEGLR
jgi:hypothetical protein